MSSKKICMDRGVIPEVSSFGIYVIGCGAKSKAED